MLLASMCQQAPRLAPSVVCGDVMHGIRKHGPVLVLVLSCRMLYMMGQLCRHGADIIDAEAAQKPSTHNCTECLELCVR